MGKNKDLQRPGFLFLTSYYEAIKDFLDNELKWEFIEAIVRFGSYGEQPDFSRSKYAPFLAGLWKLTLPTLEKSITNYQNRKDKRKSQKDKDTDKGKDKDTDKDKDKDKDRDLERNRNEPGTNQNESGKRGSASRFTPPSIEEIKQYIVDAGLSAVSAESFFDYYSSCGWTIGANKKMKDWKSAMRRWDREEKEKKSHDRLHVPNRKPEDFEGVF